MIFEGFCDGSYRSQSPNANAEACINWYPERVERNGKTAWVLYPSPGLKSFSQIVAGGPVRGLFELVGRPFTVIGAVLYELSAAGVATNRGAISSDALPVSVAGGPTQLGICSNGTFYIYDMAGNTLTAIGAGLFNDTVSMCGYLDGYFLALLGGTHANQFQVSTLYDGTLWNLTQYGTVSRFPDNVVSMLIDRGEVWLFGPKATIIYYNSGAANFPFEPLQVPLIQVGCAAKFSPAKLDNTIFWLGSDERGTGMVWKANGYTPQRVSDHALEYEFSTYSTLSDAVGYAFQDQGHTFYHLYFPTAKKSWRLDVATGKWSQPAFWNASTGKFDAHHSQNHAFCFGKHLVGDWNSGTIYDMSINYADDNGKLIRRVRRAPHLCEEQKWVFYPGLQIDLETGLGTMPPLVDGNGNARDPIATLAWSNDGGHTFTGSQDAPCGQAGNFKARVMFKRLGRSRDRVYELSVTDPIPWRVIGAYHEPIVSKV